MTISIPETGHGSNLAFRLKNCIYTLSAGFNLSSLERLKKMTGRTTVFPFYHLVSDGNPIHIRHLYTARTTKEFTRDLDDLLKHFRPLDPLRFMEEYRQTGRIEQGGFLLSFDDGLREVAEVALPVLRKKGLAAICFLNSAFLGNRDLFFRYKASILIDRLIRKPASPALAEEIRTTCIRYGLKYRNSPYALLGIRYADRTLLDELAVLLETDFTEYLAAHKPYMDRYQVDACLQAGFLAGAHSVDHPLFSALPESQQLLQARESLRMVQNEFDTDYGLFSFPFTDQGIAGSLFDSLFSGSDPRFDLTFGCAGLKDDACERNIQRIPMESGRFRAATILQGEYLYYILKSLPGRNLIRRS